MQRADGNVRIVPLVGRESEDGVPELLAAAQIHRRVEDRTDRGPVIAAQYADSPVLRLFGYEIHGHVRAVAGVEDGGEGHWILRDLAVEEGSRGSGIGRRLLRYLEEELGAATIVGDTVDPATGFYESCGWRVTPADQLPDGRTMYRFGWSAAEDR